MKGIWGFSLGVTGNTLNPDTEATIEKIRQLVAITPVDFILLTGGVFEQKSGQTIPASHLMRTQLGDLNTPIYIGDQSTITRDDVKEGQAILEQNEIVLKEVELIAVSEYWHLKGIKILLKGKFKHLRLIPSDYKLEVKRIFGRIARLPLYYLDPTGEGNFAKWGIKRREF